MYRKRGAFSLPIHKPGDSVWKPADNRVVLTSVMSRSWKLQIPQPQSRLSLVLEDQMTIETDRWAEAGSPTDLAPHHLGFLPMSGRLMKSESEDSGVEMASGDHAPLTPVESEKSFSLDYQDGFQMAGEDESAPAPREGCPKEDGPQELLPVLDRAYWQELCVKRKFTEMGQRSQKNHLYVRTPNKLIQRRQSLVDLEELKSRYPHRPVSVDGLLDEASGGYSQTTSGRGTLEKTEKKNVSMSSPFIIPAARFSAAEAFRKDLTAKCRPELQSQSQNEAAPSATDWAQQPASLPMPGPGVRCLENLCQLMEKVSQLQKANTQLQHERQLLECRVRALECQVCTLQQEKKCFFEQITEEPKQPQTDPQPGDPEAVETEKEEEGNPANEEEYLDLVDSWHPHSFRARSASDTHMFRRQTHHLGNKIDRSMMSALHSASSPSLVERLGSGFHTWPSSQKAKNDRSRWGRVKGLLNRIRRRSSKTSEVIPSSDTATKSRHRRADPELDQEGFCPRRRFLPNLMVKIHRSKHVSMG
ncbi:uncharacterized protein LOC107289258 [Protobothrops mucrosquamatus]|uniref:uncharacterized protein LOC107289258 n=1 Tax=Protobothrops mucrosquamatus TaxID=103944 RepID=UPI0010FAD9FC|nr:uncharacterized protein LOC107289258 [Protobothrops mucrosquamatus]